MNVLPDGTPIRRVLVVAYVFPPAGGAGVQRVTKFVKYLPEFGWDCSVLTVANPSVPVFDETLAKDVPESTVVRLAKTLEPGYALKNAVSAGSGGAGSSKQSGGLKKLIKAVVRAAGNAILQPDAQILWYPGAVKEGLQLLSELKHDAIFVTAPPFSSFVTGAALSRRSGLPLIVDYRDEWGISNQFQENRQKSSFSHRLQDRMQRKVLRQASAVIATTGRSAESVRESVERAGSSATVSCIYNGYDAADFPNVANDSLNDSIGDSVSPRAASDLKPEETTPSDERQLRIAYVGTLWNLTSIEPVVSAIEKLAAEDRQKAERIELVVAGRRTGAQDEILDRLESLPCRLVRESYVEHKRAIEIMNQADVQCLLLSDVPEAGRVVPAKTFEYLALGRKILYVGPDGEVREILSEFPQAESYLPADADGIADYFSRHLDESPVNSAGANTVSARRFERRSLTRQLAELLNQTCGAGAGLPAVPGDAGCEVADCEFAEATA